MTGGHEDTLDDWRGLGWTGQFLVQGGRRSTLNSRSSLDFVLAV